MQHFIRANIAYICRRKFADTSVASSYRPLYLGMPIHSNVK